MKDTIVRILTDERDQARADSTEIAGKFTKACARELEAALRKVKSGLPWTDKGDALFALCEAALSTPSETACDDLWHCVCGCTVRKGLRCLCGGREDNSTSDRTAK